MQRCKRQPPGIEPGNRRSTSASTRKGTDGFATSGPHKHCFFAGLWRAAAASVPAPPSSTALCSATKTPMPCTPGITATCVTPGTVLTASCKASTSIHWPARFMSESARPLYTKPPSGKMRSKSRVRRKLQPSTRRTALWNSKLTRPSGHT